MVKMVNFMSCIFHHNFKMYNRYKAYRISRGPLRKRIQNYKYQIGYKSGYLV